MVCTNTPVQIVNNSVGASSYYWSFCQTNFTDAPDALNLGNPAGQLNGPVFLDIVQDNSGNYFVFVVNNYSGQLVRMNFGNSLLNTPVVDNLGTLGGAIPGNAEGIQFVNVNGDWIAILVGGELASGNPSAIVKIDFGADLTSTPVATNWGNIGNLSYPHELYLFNQGNNWYGYTTNADNNTLTLFDFGVDFSNPPTGANLGNVGGLNAPTGMSAINSNGNWFLFIVNSDNNTITRGEFGNSLLNPGTYTNIGNPGGSLADPRDISFIQLCSGVKGLVVNQYTNSITSLDFGDNPGNMPVSSSLGNVGALNFPHSISKLFRVGNDIYTFIPNVYTNSLTRVRFAGCSTPGSTQQAPPSFTYTQPGTYNINLIVDLGLPTETSFCKQIVVNDCSLGSCNNWLGLPSLPSYVSVGDLDVPGNQITVEAEINRTTPYVGGSLYAGDIVSKHKDPVNINYLLRPNSAEITTADGVYHITPPVCDIELNKTYHVAMVYDGTTLKFYRNGFLLSQTNVSGNLFQNNFPTQIGIYNAQLYNEQFVGYVNEVRIWNVARTQAQIQAYMNVSLPSPTTQPGLLAYYVFNDLQNKQGNPAWNGTLGGSAAINQFNPTCSSFVADDNCCVTQTGTLTGNSICPDETGQLTFHSTSPSTPPYTIVYSDGTNNYTQTNVQDGVPFAVATQPTTTTNYTLVTIQDATACPPSPISGQTATIEIKQNCCPKISTTFAGNAVCPGQTGQLTFHTTTTPVTPPFTVVYTDGTNTYTQTNVQDGISFPTPITINANSSFPLISVQDASGCPATTVTGQAAAVIVYPLPVLQIGQDTSICSGSSAQLHVSGASLYQWTPALYLDNASAPNPIATPPSATKFSVTGTDANNCQSQASVQVSILPPVTFNTPPPDANVCVGSAVQLKGANDAKYIYQWTPSDYLNDPGSVNPIASPPQSMQYSLQITSPVCGETASFPVSVQVNDLPVVRASRSNDLDCITGVSQLSASGAESYAWTPTTGLDNPFSANPEAAIDSTTTFEVTGTDLNGCSGSDRVTVVVTAKGKAMMVLPNAFTPNGDGRNDCFGIRKWGNVTIEQFTIYNRWGQKVFDTQNPQDCWDGTFHGEKQDSGQYVYVIKATSFCGPIMRKGTLLLIR
ncbi:MAG TPA: gliding motility-associated C-terminal domain-containing protein [Puia sp.]|nr:gliding motility-associated C-terminal domain-containing protein [Puia sp.]